MKKEQKIKVEVNYPEDMSQINDVMAEIIIKWFVKRYGEKNTKEGFTKWLKKGPTK